jgi:flavin-dependent dehydrogenase
VGDSAGFYDPFTGEGVTLALRSAALAAEALHAALRGRGRIPRLLAYERARHAATSHKFRFNRALQAAGRSPPGANAIARRLTRRPDLADRLVGIAGDCVPAGSAFSPAFLWDVLTA